MRRLVRGVVVGAHLAATAAFGAPQYESPHVHPITTTTDRVLVVNTPDARLSIFHLEGGLPVLTGEVAVGMEPISVRALDDGVAWVVNHLSDDVTIVDIATGTPIYALHVGDEPADVVFVESPTTPGAKWAVISLSQEDRVVVHETSPPYARLATIDMPGSDPRALAVTPAGDAVWVATFESGNHSTIVPRYLKSQGPWSGFDPPVPPIVPPLNPDLPDSLLPDNGVIVRKVAGVWRDEQGGNWSSVLSWDLADADLVRISFGSPQPAIDAVVSGVGTLLYDVAVDPATGDLFVPNTEAHNEVYFEPKLFGSAVRNDLTRVDALTLTAHVFALNTHVDEGPPGQPTAPSPPALRAESLAIPHGAVVSSVTGQRLVYVSAIGSERMAAVDPSSGVVVRRLPVTRGGTGLAVVPGGQDLLLVNRLENTLEVVDPMTGTQASVSIGASGFDPTDTLLREGRRLLYTGAHSAHGTFACASCHAHANVDQLAWDLGDPTGELQQLDPEDNGGLLVAPFHPLKGPMVTQTLRGMRDAGLMHWRGDRLDLTRFNPAFASLMGGDTLSTSEIHALEAFVLALDFPPNPLVGLTDQPPADVLGGSPIVGLDVFLNAHNEFCVRCHALPLGTSGFVAPIDTVAGLGHQPMKVAHLRNLYEKVGFTSFTSLTNKLGYGYTHDGSENDIDEFLDFFLGFFTADELVDVRAMLLSFPTGTHGAVGQEVTIDAASVSLPGVRNRFDTLQGEADRGAIDFVAHTRIDGEPRGFYRVGSTYQSDRSGETWGWSDVVAHVTAGGAPVVFMAVPAGQGIRMGIDRDEDGFYDTTERDAGSDPADPDSTPTIGVALPDEGASLVTRILGAHPTPFLTDVAISVYAGATGSARLEIFDVRGRRVRRLLDETLSPGRRDVRWDGCDEAGRAVASGVYVARFRAGATRTEISVLRLR